MTEQTANNGHRKHFYLFRYKKCTGIRCPLGPYPDFNCALCLVIAHPIDGRDDMEEEVCDENVEVDVEFCYLGDMLSAGSG